LCGVLAMSEPLVGGIGSAAWELEDTIRDVHVEEYPSDPEARQAYFDAARADAHYKKGLLALVALSVVETPTWCQTSSSLFASVDPDSQCTIAGVDHEEILLSNIPYIPPGWGIAIELLVMLVILRKLRLEWKLQSKYFDPLRAQYYSLRTIKVLLALVVVEVVDCIVFVSFQPGFRLAFLSRTGLLWLLPGVQSLAACFVAVIGEFVSISVFLVAAIVFFTWITVCIFADMDDLYNGAPVNKGLDTFMNTLDTMWVAGTTDAFVDRFLPTYSKYRSTGLLWLLFLVIVHVLFLSLVLDTLVSAYTEYHEESEKHAYHEKMHAVTKIFKKLLASSEGSSEKLSKDAFVEFTQEFSNSPCNRPISEAMAGDMFRAVNKRGTGDLSKKEFLDACRLITLHPWTTRKFSALEKRYPGLWESAGFQWFKEQVDGEDKRFDGFMNMVLFINLGLVVIETVYDMNDWQETPLMESLELIFAFVYLTEVCLRLSVYSWQEYWAFGSNRFDFFTTFALLGSSAFELFLSESGNAANLKRYMNILRLLRLLRMVKQIKRMRSVQFMVNTVIKLVLGSKDILTALGVVIYFFTMLSIQLWGGLLYSTNPALEETSWKESKWFVLNFNDFLMAFGVWIVTLLCEYVPQFTQAIARASSIPGCWMIFPIFYVVGVMIVFELVKAFTIEMFMDLNKKRNEEEQHGGPFIFRPLAELEKDFAERDIGFHYTMGSSGLMEEE